MKEFPKLIKRVLSRTMLMMLCLFLTGIFTMFLGVIYFAKDNFNRNPILLLKRIDKHLTYEENRFLLDSLTIQALEKNKAWAMLIDNESGNVSWSQFLPDSIPLHYTISDIAVASRNYLKNHPTFVWKHTKGLIVIGTPPGSFARFSTFFPVNFLQNFYWYTFISYIIQLVTILFIFFFIDRKMLRSLRPILKGIQNVAEGKEVHLIEKGTFSEIAAYLNRTSFLLKKRATVRENWLAGVSHDIRTPLASILGYAGQIEAEKTLPPEVTQKASIIRNQAIRLRELISDLNLSSRLEHDDHLVQYEKFDLARFCREIIADFLNNYGDENYPLDIHISDSSNMYIQGNPHLLQRGIYNLLSNSIRHNPEGCHISVRLENTSRYYLLTFSDDGKGIPPGLMEKLRMIQEGDDSSTLLTGQEHGLGLYIVCQIVKMHGGTVVFTNGNPKGFKTILSLPKDKE